MAALSSHRPVHNVPQTLGVWVGWGKGSLKWKLIFPVCDSGPQKAAGGSSAAPGAAAEGRALPHIAPSAHKEGYSTWESQPGCLGRFLNSMTRNVGFLPSEKKKKKKKV